MNKSVIVRGPLLTKSGYGTHSRQIFDFLDKNYNELYVQTLPWGITSWNLNTKNKQINSIIKKTQPVTKKANVSVQIQLPNEWDTSIAHFNIGVTAAVEADRMNPKWVECCEKMNAIIVPSNFTKQVLVDSGVKNKNLFVIGEHFHENFNKYIKNNKTNTNISRDIDNLNTKFNFVLFGQLTGHTPISDRKNIFNTIKVFCDTFKDNKDVGLIIKTNLGKNTTSDRVKTENIIQNVLSEVKQGEFPRIHLVHGDLNELEKWTLLNHNSVKAFVTLTRGEGFGIPGLEFSLTGKPIFATNWSGHLDYLKNFVKINYSMVPVHFSKVDGEVYLNGFKWAEPDYENFSREIKLFYNNPKMYKNCNNKQYSFDNFNKNKIQSRYKSVFKKLGILN